MGGMNEETTPASQECENFECPNEDEEGGLFQSAPCSPEFCDCSFGVPYKLTCEDPLVFDEESQVCNWCYNMCDKCSDCGGCPQIEYNKRTFSKTCKAKICNHIHNLNTINASSQ